MALEGASRSSSLKLFIESASPAAAKRCLSQRRGLPFFAFREILPQLAVYAVSSNHGVHETMQRERVGS